MALEKITMPKLGESVTEGTINTWLVSVGDHVEKYDPIVEVMTDKVNAEIPSSFSGIIKEFTVEEGDTVAVGEVVCQIETDADETDASQTETSEETTSEATNDTTENETEEKDSSMKNRYSPAVMRLAQEHNIDLNQVEGSGLGGRITRKDINQFIENGPTQSTSKQSKAETSAPHSASKVSQPAKELALNAGDREYELKGVRKIIADNMVRSKTEIPHAWMTVEVDVTELANYRNEIKDQFKQREGISLTYFSFFVYAVSRALKEFPEFNSVWNGNKVIERKDINMSIAVAKGNELFVPVIRNADNLSMTGIAKEVNRLATKGREGKLTADDMADGTFTLNNTGSFGSISSMGIINHPQVAILQVESIVKRPMIINDMFAARDMVNLSLSMDHRVLDGLICGNFLKRIKEILEGINKENTSI